MPISAIRSPRPSRGASKPIRGASRTVSPPGPQRRPVRLRRQRRARFALDPVIPVHHERSHAGLEHRGDAGLKAHLDDGYASACDRIAAGGFDVLHNNSLSRLPLEKRRTAATPTVTSLHVPPYDALRWFVQASPARDTGSPRPPGRISTRGGRTGRPRRPRCFTTASIPPPGRIVRTATAAPSGARGSRPTRARSTRSGRRAKPACP